MPTPPRTPHRVCIIGAGPAGMSCALWLANLGLEPTLIDAEKAPGGAMQLNFLNNNWVLGQRDMSGLEISARFTTHIASLNIPLELESQPTHISRNADGTFRITLETPNGISGLDADALVIASGSRFRGREVLLGLPGFSNCDPGRLRFGPHCFTRISALEGKHLLIIGGGDNALENASHAVAAGAKVTLAARSRFHGQDRFIHDLHNSDNCALHADTRLIALQPVAQGIEASLENAAGPWKITVDRIHMLAGYAPNTAFLSGVLAADFPPLKFDDRGYLITDAQGRCGIPGLYAAGDVCNPAFPNVLTALALGAQVAKTIETDLTTHSRS